jgi:gas vesicle protein
MAQDFLHGCYSTECASYYAKQKIKIMEAKNLIGGILAGAAIGVAIGILLAPESGEKTRNNLVKGSRKLTDSLQDTVEESIESLKARFNAGVDDAVKKGKETVNHAGERVKA